MVEIRIWRPPCAIAWLAAGEIRTADSVVDDVGAVAAGLVAHHGGNIGAR